MKKYMKKIKEKHKLIFLIIALSSIVLSGCMEKSVDKAVIEQNVSSKEVISPSLTQTSQLSQSIDQDKIIKLENEIYSMQQQINDMQMQLERAHLLNPSTNTLIPNVPFRIEVYRGEWQVPLTMTFKEGNQMEFRDEYGTEIGQYKLFANNNTIKISSKKYDYYGYVLYDDYITAVYENGWISWVLKYKIIPPKFNSLTQKYELT